MKGIILAGGTGSRLSPLTKVTNKHLLPVGQKPMIIHSVDKLVSAGVTDIMVITGTEHMGDMITLLGSGRDYKCSFTFRVQDKPDGIAGALLLCENFSNNDNIVVILGDNIFEDNLLDIITQFDSRDNSVSTCLLCLKEVDDPTRFGVPEIFENKVIRIVEKPVKPPSNYCVTGIYIYDNNVFDYIRDLQKSERGEYEITDVNNVYISSGEALSYSLTGQWTDAGTHESYYCANKLMSELQ